MKVKSHSFPTTSKMHRFSILCAFVGVCMVSSTSLSHKSPPIIARAEKSITAGGAESRGVNWVEARKHEFPFFARVILRAQIGEDMSVTSGCGGSLIAPQVVLTAAHCYNLHIEEYNEIRSNEMFSVFGSHDLNNADGREVEIRAGGYYVHPKFPNQKEEDAFAYDIALMYLSTPAPKSATIACISNREVGGNVPVTCIGFGLLREEGPGATILRKSENIKTMSNEDCINNTDMKAKDVVPQVICAMGKGPRGIEDSCGGDSGGPLFRRVGDKWVIDGIVSYGFGCALERLPGMYTRVSFYVNELLESARAHYINDICVV